MRRLALFLGGLAVVLLLLAFDERQTTAAVEAVGARLQPLIEKVRKAVGAPPPAAPPPAAGAWPVLFGLWEGRDTPPTGDLIFAAAEIRLETGEVWTSRPLRIAFGREAVGRPLKLADDDQLELRTLTGAKGESLAGSSVCEGDAPGYVGLRRDPDGLRMMVFRAGPAPDQTDPGPALCGVWSYRKR